MARTDYGLPQAMGMDVFEQAVADPQEKEEREHR
jgi:hypothetical protein